MSAKPESIIELLNDRNLKILADARKDESLPPPKRLRVHTSLLSHARAKPIRGFVPLRFGAIGALIERAQEKNQA